MDVSSKEAADPRDGLASCGADVTIYRRAQILGREHITIGDRVIIDDYVMIYATAPTRIGSFVHIASHTTVAGGGVFEMGDFSGLSGGVRVYTGNEDYRGGSLTNPTVPSPWRNATRSAVRIGAHAIVGANSVILPGVTIGEGCSVGALSLVIRDLDPWGVYVGSPAKKIGERPSDRIRALEADLRAHCYRDGRYVGVNPPSS